MTNPKHKTDEYLAWIDYELNWLGEGEIVVGRNFRASLLANRDVLVRHELTKLKNCPTCSDWRWVNGRWQGNHYLTYCPTYLDIAQRLDEVM